MTSDSSKAAPIRWYQGLPLLPEHFEQQERALREEIHLRASLLRGPYWGVGQLSLDDKLLSSGTLMFNALSLVLPSGRFVDISVNAKRPEALSLPLTKNKVSVFLHLMIPEKDEIFPEKIGEKRTIVEKRCSRLVLSTGDALDESAESFHLLDLVHTPLQGLSWELDPDYIPATLLVRANSPFFKPFLERIRDLELKLATMLQSSGKERSPLFQEGALAMALGGLYHLQAMIADVEVIGGGVHPLDLFSALRGFYIGMCLRAGEVASRVKSTPYNHSALAHCFKEILDAIEFQSRNDNKLPNYTAFIQSGDRWVADLDKVLAITTSAMDVFMVVLKERMSDQIDLKGLTLAAPSKLDDAIRRSFNPVPFEQAKSMVFQSLFSASAEFYVLHTGAGWDLAVKERKLAFYDSLRLKGLAFYLHARPKA